MEHPDKHERDQFDLDWGVNTASPLARIAYRKIANLEKGNAYQASWTTEIRTSFDLVHRQFKDTWDRFTFVDVGCGKGKVNIVWQQELDRLGLEQRNVGVDYYEPLVTIARNNWRRLYPTKEARFHVADAATHDFRRHGEKLILYMFNPFSTVVLLQMLRNLGEWPTVIIYNVPACDQIIRSSGYTVISDRSGPNQNQNTVIYKNF
jgi:SAM-dependent methyltransferase